MTYAVASYPHKADAFAVNDVIRCVFRHFELGWDSPVPTHVMSSYRTAIIVTAHPCMP